MVTILLPAYNESDALPLLIPAIDRVLKGKRQYQILIVDDGSTDDTAVVAKKLQGKYPLNIISHKANSGLGAAMKTGLKAAISPAYNSETIVAMDADNTHNPQLIPSMLEVLETKDIVIASRYAKGGKEIGLSTHRKLLSMACNKILKVVFPIVNCRDYTCGYRAYRGDIIKKGFSEFGDNLIEETSFVCMAELLIKLASTGANVTEVGLELRYDLKHGASKMQITKTILKYVKLIAMRNKIASRA